MTGRLHTREISQIPELRILSGLPASGKSTIAKAWVAEDPDARIRINWDEARIGRYGPDWVFNRVEEDQMQKASFTTTKRALIAGISVVVDNTNLTTRSRARWSELGRHGGATIIEQEIDTPVAECVRRDRLRTGRARVGRAVIENYALRYGFLTFDDAGGLSSKKQLVLCDIDGTLADCTHRRRHLLKDYCINCNAAVGRLTLVDGSKGNCAVCSGPVRSGKDWPAFFRECHLDTPIQPIINLVKRLAETYRIIIVSGRPINLCGKATEDWLDDNDVPYQHLFMRPDDHRPDTEVKQEILDLLPKDRIAYVIDDRPQVLRMWQTAGLTTLAVGNLKEF